jgi:phosphopantetheinyl transferase
MQTAISITNGAKTDFLAGRVALKTAFNQYLSKNKIHSLEKVVINNSQSGQPYIEGYETLHCSIGHSYGLGVGAVAPFRIGVDVEKIRPHKDSLANYIAELKESVMKALGVGFKISPRQVKIMRQGNKFFEVEVSDSKPSYWYVWPVDTEDYYISVAYEKKHGQKTGVDWDSKIGVSSANA